MPKYEYKCVPCNSIKMEVVRRMDEAEPGEGYLCPDCGSRLVRSFSPTPVKFNGPGFYSTGG